MDSAAFLSATNYGSLNTQQLAFVKLNSIKRCGDTKYSTYETLPYSRKFNYIGSQSPRRLPQTDHRFLGTTNPFYYLSCQIQAT